jgi:predicted CopG family antitoxin
MGTKTISLSDEAHERLRRARLNPSESFSDVVMRANWPAKPLLAGEFLDVVRERYPVYSASELDRVDEASA